MKLLRSLVCEFEKSETSILKSPQATTYLCEIIIDSILVQIYERQTVEVNLGGDRNSQEQD